MKTFMLTASAIALIPAAANAQLLGGGLGGTLGGTVNGTVGSTIGSTVDNTTRTVRGTVDGSASSEGDQSVNAREGRVSANRSANGSVTGSTASLADLPIPALRGNSASASGSGSASGQGNADAQLIGTDAARGAIAPIAGNARNVAGNVAARTNATAQGLANSAPTPGMPALGGASAEGSGLAEGNGSASLVSSPLAVAGSTASAGEGMASVAPGMPVFTPDGASLGKVRQVVANGRGEVQQVVVKQGNVTRTLPAGMFSANGNALIAGEAKGATATPAEQAE